MPPPDYRLLLLRPQPNGSGATLGSLVTDSAADRTPARRGSSSNLGQGDLLRRVKRLALPAEAVPRVLRFLETEIGDAVASRSEFTFSAEEIRRAGGDDALVEALRAQRKDQQRVDAIRRAGLAELPAEALEALLAEARR